MLGDQGVQQCMQQPLHTSLGSQEVRAAAVKGSTHWNGTKTAGLAKRPYVQFESVICSFGGVLLCLFQSAAAAAAVTCERQAMPAVLCCILFCFLFCCDLLCSALFWLCCILLCSAFTCTLLLTHLWTHLHDAAAFLFFPHW